jgi:hypothetical protein
VGVVIGRLDSAGRVGVVAHGIAGLVALWFAASTSGGTRLGPARTDDLPYGDLITLNRSGALVWLAVAAIGLAGLLLGLRAVRLITAGMWLLLAVVCAAVVIGDGELFGMSRPGDIAVVLGLAATLVVAGLQPGASHPSPSRSASSPSPPDAAPSS